MKDGFLRVAAVTPKITVADCEENTGRILERAWEAYREGAVIIVFPELCITGYTCQDLFWQQELIESAKNSLEKIRKETEGMKGLLFVGLPWEHEGKLYNTAAVLNA